MAGVFTHQEVAAVDLTAEADDALVALRSVSLRLADLVSDAVELDDRADAIERRERELAEARQALDWRELVLEHEQRLVEERARKVDERANRLHWRWLMGIWRWRPPIASRAFRVCEFLFVPTPAGYVLLEQEGVALRPGAILTGLTGSDARFQVTKIAQWDLDGRWCAYMQQISQPNEERGIDGVD
jgi:hypothetical protein